MKKIGIIGYGSWGSALAVLLGTKGHCVYLTGRNKDFLRQLEQDRENKRYLPSVKFPDNICFTSSYKDFKDAEIVVFAVPSQSFRGVFEEVKDYLNERTIVVSVAKGIENSTLLTLSQVAKEVAPSFSFVELSGPSHAEEVGKSLPTTVVSASEDIESAKVVQETFMTPNFRVYTSQDIIGVEVAGSMKNVIALAAGISDGLGFGDNTKAALITRGLAEITRLGVKMGADAFTFSGLSGIGDLIVTCTSSHSRNRKFGYLIGKGFSNNEAMKEVNMVVEGVYTCQSAYELGKKLKVELPITEKLYQCLNGQITAEVAIEELMGRSPKNESLEVYL